MLLRCFAYQQVFVIELLINDRLKLPTKLKQTRMCLSILNSPCHRNVRKITNITEANHTRSPLNTHAEGFFVV